MSSAESKRPPSSEPSPRGGGDLGSGGEALPPAPRDWLSVPERGTLLGIRVVAALASLVGRRVVRALVSLVALYYLLSDSRARTASRIWWTRVEGRSPSVLKIYDHLRRFAHVAVDRIYLVQNDARSLVFTREGSHHLEVVERSRRGAILLGAHLGSFEAMRLGGRQDSLQINIVGNFANAKMVNQILQSLSGDQGTRVIHAAPGDVGFIFEIQQRIAAGELVAILGDRVASGQAFVSVPFFGRPARFPTGPFHLASLLKCPMFLTFGIFREPNRYELSCEPFVDEVRLPRGRRTEAVREYVHKYAQALEAKAKLAPDNWFNFFDFWEDSPT